MPIAVDDMGPPHENAQDVRVQSIGDNNSSGAEQTPARLQSGDGEATVVFGERWREEARRDCAGAEKRRDSICGAAGQQRTTRPGSIVRPVDRLLARRQRMASLPVGAREPDDVATSGHVRRGLRAERERDIRGQPDRPVSDAACALEARLVPDEKRNRTVPADGATHQVSLVAVAKVDALRHLDERYVWKVGEDPPAHRVVAGVEVTKVAATMKENDATVPQCPRDLRWLVVAQRAGVSDMGAACMEIAQFAEPNHVVANIVRVRVIDERDGRAHWDQVIQGGMQACAESREKREVG